MPEQNETAPTRIVLAEDHQVVREGVRVLLEAQPDFHIVGETGDGLEAVRLIERLGPEVAVVDLVLPSLGGLEITRQVRKLSPRSHVVILSMHPDEAYVVEAMRNGASAYVLKGSSAVELVQAIREAAAGRRYLSPTLAQAAIDAYLQTADKASSDPYDALTAREREVFHLAAEGHKNAAIATRLFISARTVENHRANVMRKLGLQDQTELVRYAVRLGILPEEPTRKR